MYRKHTTYGRAIAVALGIGCLALAGCTGKAGPPAGGGSPAAPASAAGPAAERAAFLRTDAGIVERHGEPYTATFPFVAEESDPIWRYFGGMSVVSATDVDVTNAVVHPGSAKGNLQLGTITADLLARPGTVSFSQIELYTRTGSEPRRVDVGPWKIEWLTRAASDGPVEPVGAVPALMPSCEWFDLDLANRSAGWQRVVAIGTPAAKVSFVSLGVGRVIPAGGHQAFHVEVSCNAPGADWYAFSPVITTTGKSQKQIVNTVGVVIVGAQDPSAQEMTRIWEERHA